MDFVVLQDLSTLRNGGFDRGKARMKMMKKKDKVCWSAASSPSSLSLTNRHVAAISSSSETPTYSPHKNQVTDSYSLDFKTRLWKLISKGKLEEGFKYLKNTIVFSSREQTLDLAVCRGLIEALCSTGRTGMAAQVLQLLERSETTTLDTRTYTKFVEGLCKAGELDNALKLFERLPCKPDVYMYNTLINAMFRKGRFEQAMKLLNDMTSQGIEPDNVTCSTVVNGMCKQGRLDEAIRLVTSSRIPSCVESYNAVLNCLCYTGRLNDAAKLFSDMLDRDCLPSAVTFTILIRTLCSEGLMYQGISLLESMPEYGITPNLYHYNRIIHGLCKQNDMAMAVECIEVMISRNCYPTIVVFNTLLAALWEHGKVDAGVDLFKELTASRCCGANQATYDIVIEGLSSSGRVDEALEVLDEARGIKGFKPDAIGYAKLIVALVQERRLNEAMGFFDELKRSGVVVVPVKCCSWIVEALCGVGEVDRAIKVVVYMVSKGCGRGRIWQSQTAFAEVIEGLARAGLGRESVELLNELIVRGAMNRDMSIAVAERLEKMASQRGSITRSTKNRELAQARLD